MSIDKLIEQWRNEGKPWMEALEQYEERAAIREYDAGFRRQEAEQLALNELKNRRKTIDAEKKGNV